MQNMLNTMISAHLPIPVCCSGHHFNWAIFGIVVILLKDFCAPQLKVNVKSATYALKFAWLVCAGVHSCGGVGVVLGAHHHACTYVCMVNTIIVWTQGPESHASSRTLARQSYWMRWNTCRHASSHIRRHHSVVYVGKDDSGCLYAVLQMKSSAIAM